MKDFLSWAQGIFDWVERDNKAAELERACKIVRNHYYYQGKQCGYMHPITGLYQTIPNPEGFITYNVIRPIVKRVAQVWARSNSKMKVVSWSNQHQKSAGARQATKIAQFYQERLLSPTLRQREGKYAQLSGEYFRYVYFNPDGGLAKEKPTYAEREFVVGSDSRCLECAAVVEGEVCQCGSSQKETLPRLAVMEQTGSEEVREGEIELDIVDPLEMKIDLSAREFKDSSYLRRKRRLRRDYLKSKLKRDFAASSTTDEILRMQRELEVSAGSTGRNSSSSTRTAEDEEVEFTELWLQRYIYEDYTFATDIVIADKEIAAGTSLVELCPDGLLLQSVGKEVVDFWNEDFRDNWSFGVYDMVPTKLRGDGIEDLIPKQDLINDSITLFFTQLMHNTSPPLAYDERIGRENLVYKPGMTFPVAGRQSNERLSDYFYQLPPGPVTPVINGFVEAVMRDAFMSGGANSLTTATPEVDNKTATGAQIMNDQTMALIGLQLAIRAEVDVLTVTQILKLAQKYWSDEKYLPLLGKYSSKEGEWFRSSDIPKDFVVVAVANSWMPRSETESRQDLISALGALGVPFGPWNEAVPPQLRKLVFERHNIDMDEDGYAVDVKVAQSTLERLQIATAFAMAAGEVEPVLDPATGAVILDPVEVILEQVPIDPFAHNPSVQIEVITDFLKQDEQRNPLLTRVLHTRIQQLFRAQAELMALRTTLQPQQVNI